MEEILEYSIQAETLKNTANAIREYVTFLKHSIDSSVGVEGSLINGAVSVAYTIYEDKETYTDPMIGLDSIFALQSYGFEEDKNGKQILVLYDAPQELIAEADKFYYVKRETYEGQEYDKWRKISPNEYTWDTLAKCYIYTNQIVVTESVFEEINPVDFPEHIELVYGQGYSDGYEEGINTGGGGSPETTGFEYNNPEVMEIANYAFISFSNLTKVSASSVNSIGDFAFKDCENLTEISIPSCESIGYSAFENTGIRELVLPGCSGIGRNAFANCEFLSSITYQGRHDYFVFATNLASGSNTAIPGSLAKNEVFSNVPAEGITFYQAGSGGDLGVSYFLSFDEYWN